MRDCENRTFYHQRNMFMLLACLPCPRELLRPHWHQPPPLLLSALYAPGSSCLHPLLLAHLSYVPPPQARPLRPSLASCRDSASLTLYLSLSDLSDKRAPRTPDGYHYVVRF